MRAIDGDELLGIERLLDTDVVRQSKTASWLLDQVLHDIQAMPTLTPPNDPLTLDELWEMDGQPVWIIRMEDVFGWWAIVRISKERANSDYGAYFMLSDYGKTWLAYAYPPAHIDREAWEPCGLCNGAKYVYGHASAVVPNGDNGQIEKEIEGDFDYCPECGRPLTEKGWEDLEKRLRG